MNDERLRELYAQGLMDRNAERGMSAGCDVSPEAMLALLRGELREAERLELLDRVMSSPRCQEEFTLLRAVETAGRALELEEQDGDGGDDASPQRREVAFVRELRPVAVPFPASSAAPAAAGAAAARGTAADAAAARGAAADAAAARLSPPPRPATAPATKSSRQRYQRAPWWRRNAVPMALAATLLLAVGLSLGDRGGIRGGADVTRGGADGVELLVPSIDGTATAGSALAFAWRPVAGAVRYQFELLSADGTLVHESSTADTLVVVTRPPLEPGREYRWLVRAYDSAGAQRGSAVRALRTRG